MERARSMQGTACPPAGSGGGGNRDGEGEEGKMGRTLCIICIDLSMLYEEHFAVYIKRHICGV